MVFILQFVDMMYHTDWFVDIEPSLGQIPGLNPSGLWCMIILTYGWIQFANILLKIFAAMFVNDNSL